MTDSAVLFRVKGLNNRSNRDAFHDLDDPASVLATLESHTGHYVPPLIDQEAARTSGIWMDPQVAFPSVGGATKGPGGTGGYGSIGPAAEGLSASLLPAAPATSEEMV